MSNFVCTLGLLRRASKLVWKVLDLIGNVHFLITWKVSNLKGKLFSLNWKRDTAASSDPINGNEIRNFLQKTGGGGGGVPFIHLVTDPLLATLEIQLSVVFGILLCVSSHVSLIQCLLFFSMPFPPLPGCLIIRRNCLALYTAHSPRTSTQFSFSLLGFKRSDTAETRTSNRVIECSAPVLDASTIC